LLSHTVVHVFVNASDNFFALMRMRFKPRFFVALSLWRKLQIYRSEDREETVLTAIKTITFRGLPQDNRSFPPTKLSVEPRRELHTCELKGYKL